MKERIKKKMIRAISVLTAFCALFACSGCDEFFSYLEEWQFSSESVWELPESFEASEWENLPAWGGSEATLNFSPTVLSEQYGYQYFGNMTNGTKLQRLYKDLYNVCVSFYASSENVQAEDIVYEENDVQQSATVYEIGTLDFSAYALTLNEALMVWNVALTEFPEFYWLTHQIFYTPTQLFLYIEPEYAQAGVRRAIESRLCEEAEACYAYLTDDMSQTERALTVEEYVLTNLQYAYKSDNQTPEDAYWAHNIEGLARAQGVCETYAKTYTWLCSLMGIDCLTAVGVAGETGDMGGHAWNVVKIDNVWYNVDITWEDTSNGNPDREWMGMDSTQFNTTHVANTPDIFAQTASDIMSWFYELPECSNTRLQPVSVSVNGGDAVMYPNMDVALSAMTDATASYQVWLCPQTAIEKAGAVDIDPYEITFTTAILPSVAQLTLTGKKVSFSKYSTVTAKNKLTISSPVTIEYGKFTYSRFSSGTDNIKTGTGGVKNAV